MDIAFVEPHLRLYGGIRRIVELANQLVGRGHQVSIYHPEGTPCEWLECHAQIRQTGELRDREHDVLIHNDPNPRDLRAVAGAHARLRVFYLLGLYEKERLTGFHPFRRLTRGRTALTGRALRTADLTLANSTWMHTWIRDQMGIRSRLVIGGINRAHFHPPSAPGLLDSEFRILISGDPRERKGHRTVLQAVRRVQEAHPEVVLETYHGRGYEQEELSGVYGGAHLFVDGQSSAGWNNPVAEAMACGTPVVCTDIGGVADFAFHGETALLVPPDDPDAMAAGIKRMIKDAPLRARLRNNALRHVARFTWERSAARLEEVLEEALALRSASAPAQTAQETAAALKRIVRARLGRGRHFDKYDLRGPYHWVAFGEGGDPVYRAHVNRVVDLLEPGGTLLDVGCGDGLISARLADAGFDVTGIDIEPTGIRLAREKRPELNFILGDVFAFDGRFDVVVASEVIEHLPDPGAFLEVLKGLFRDRALITTPNREYYSDVDRYHCTEYSRLQYESLLKRHFDQVQVDETDEHLYALVR